MRSLPILLLAGCLPASSPPAAPSPTPLAPALRTLQETGLPAPISPELLEAQAWTTRPDSSLERRAAANQIPQLEGRWALYGSLADGPIATVNGGVIVCDLRLPGSAWWQSRPDMQATLEIGGQPQVLVGENNRDATVVTAPLKALATGDVLKLNVEDRDLLTKNDYIDGGTTTFPGSFPLLITGHAGKLHATCRLLKPDAVAERLKVAARQAEYAVTAFEKARGVDLTARDLGYPWNEHQAAEGGLDSVAALVGWQDPEVAPRRERLKKAKAAQMRTLADAVQTQIPRSTPAGRAAKRPGGGSLKLIAWLCGQAASTTFGEAAPDCALQIEGEGEGAELVFPDGRTEELRLMEGHPDHLEAEHTLGTDHPRKAVLLRVTSGGDAQFWRMP